MKQKDVNPIQDGLFFKLERGGAYGPLDFLINMVTLSLFSTFQNISYFLYILRMSTEQIRFLSLKMSPGEQNMYTWYFSDFFQYLTCWEISLFENLDSCTLNCHKIISDWDSTVILFAYSMWNQNLKSHEVWWQLYLWKLLGISAKVIRRAIWPPPILNRVKSYSQTQTIVGRLMFIK